MTHAWALFEGYLVGLALIILIGPVLFVLLHATLERGRAYGVAVSTGIMISDVIIVAICMISGDDVEIPERSSALLSWGGGIILLGLGLRYLISPPLAIASRPTLSARGLIKFFTKGFAVNFINPFVFLVWMGIISGVKLRYQETAKQWVFMAGTLAGIYTLDLAKVYLAHHIKPLLNPDVLGKVLRVAGALLVLFSLRLFYKGLGF